MEGFEGFSRLHAVVIGGVCLLVAAFLTRMVKDGDGSVPSGSA